MLAQLLRSYLVNKQGCLAPKKAASKSNHHCLPSTHLLWHCQPQRWDYCTQIKFPPASHKTILFCFCFHLSLHGQNVPRLSSYLIPSSELSNRYEYRSFDCNQSSSNTNSTSAKYPQTLSPHLWGWVGSHLEDLRRPATTLTFFQPFPPPPSGSKFLVPSRDLGVTSVVTGVLLFCSV